jgi:hypothetical protein
MPANNTTTVIFTPNATGATTTGFTVGTCS